MGTRKILVERFTRNFFFLSGPLIPPSLNGTSFFHQSVAVRPGHFPSKTILPRHCLPNSPPTLIEATLPCHCFFPDHYCLSIAELIFFNPLHRLSSYRLSALEHSHQGQKAKPFPHRLSCLPLTFGLTLFRDSRSALTAGLLLIRTIRSLHQNDNQPTGWSLPRRWSRRVRR